jgi:hypothetical protein
VETGRQRVETDRRHRETDLHRAATGHLRAETDRRHKATDHLKAAIDRRRVAPGRPRSNVRRASGHREEGVLREEDARRANGRKPKIHLLSVQEAGGKGHRGKGRKAEEEEAKLGGTKAAGGTKGRGTSQEDNGSSNRNLNHRRSRIQGAE